MIAKYDVRPPASVAGVATTPGGSYPANVTHKLRVYSYADVPGVGRVISSKYLQGFAVINASIDSYITWTVTPGVPYGNEEHYVPTDGYVFLVYLAGDPLYNFNYNALIIQTSATLVDNSGADWTVTTMIAQGWIPGPAILSITAQADIPRQSALSTNAAIEALAFSFIAAFRAYAASGGQVLYGHGNPNGVYTGNVGDLYTDIDTSIIWTKTSGAATNTGWTS